MRHGGGGSKALAVRQPLRVARAKTKRGIEAVRMQDGTTGFLLSHPGDKDKGVARVGHPALAVRRPLRMARAKTKRGIEAVRMQDGTTGFLLAHPGDKDKSVARVGHPIAAEHLLMRRNMGRRLAMLSDYGFILCLFGSHPE